MYSDKFQDINTECLLSHINTRATNPKEYDKVNDKNKTILRQEESKECSKYSTDDSLNDSYFKSSNESESSIGFYEVSWKAAEAKANCKIALNDINSFQEKINSFRSSFAKNLKELAGKVEFTVYEFDKNSDSSSKNWSCKDQISDEELVQEEIDDVQSPKEVEIQQNANNICINDEDIDKITSDKESNKAGQLLHDKQNIIIITGSELSSESNIPDLIEEYKTWKFNKKYTKDLKTLAATRYNKHYLKQKWDCCYKFIDLIKKIRPNNGHHAISVFQNYCKSIDKQCTIVTENIDSLQSKAANNKLTSESNSSSESTTDSDDFLEINGNIMYMRCIQECGAGLQLVSKRGPKPILKDQIPFCNNCGGAMRPHIRLINDDNEVFYNTKSVLKLTSSEVDAVIIIGSALSSHLSRKVVKKLAKKQVMIFSINSDAEEIKFKRNICNPIRVISDDSCEDKSNMSLSTVISQFFNSATKAKSNI